MSDSTDVTRSWDIQAARNLYNINRWGAKYFDINEAGHVVADYIQGFGLGDATIRPNPALGDAGFATGEGATAAETSKRS